jgi:hypothetical protein
MTDLVALLGVARPSDDDDETAGGTAAFAHEPLGDRTVVIGHATSTPQRRGEGRQFDLRVPRARWRTGKTDHLQVGVLVDDPELVAVVDGLDVCRGVRLIVRGRWWPHEVDSDELDVWRPDRVLRVVAVEVSLDPREAA